MRIGEDPAREFGTCFGTRFVSRASKSRRSRSTPTGFGALLFARAKVMARPPCPAGLLARTDTSS
jgi:hypothetical protein